MSGDIVGLAQRRGDADNLVLQGTCANPRCDQEFDRELGPGRPRDFHSEECRRRAEADRRKLTSRLEHYERQAETMRSRLNGYLRTSGDGDSRSDRSGPSPEQLQQARDAIMKVKGMTRFLRGHQDEFAQDLLELFDAVEPLIDTTAR
ncbi:MAG: hypothetical protein VYA67_16085 [Actinomycetota bacterium]|uniref:Uncharacterized protein n=1 Tax=Mycobacterium lentiflavum TaxID=141349 RepID=A0ABY3UUN6_MYCLN|nr:hypothetical protein [Mycobacterium lentiflavum]MEE3065445.1 hypothetical protein [Actinomycetota bacterium]ULP42487.1 hypothetical protein MJO58_00180 [Mycobacterium lentiflavum]